MSRKSNYEKNNKIKKKIEKIDIVEDLIKEIIIPEPVIEKIVEPIKEVEVKKETYYSKKPNYVWSTKESYVYASFDDKLSMFIKEGKERSEGVKTEFLSNREEKKLAIRKTKERKSKEKRNDK